MNKLEFGALCTEIMLSLMLIRKKQYQISTVKSIFVSISVLAQGLLGTYIMYYLENGNWGGQSFFGALLFFPLLLIPVSCIFRFPILDLLDYATIPGVALLALFKWNCYQKGCCGGKVLWYSMDGIPTHFPSQIIEMLLAIILCILLFSMEKKGGYSRKIYPICILIYGMFRYVLNLFRWEQSSFFLGLPAGNIWSMVSIFVGVIWLFTASNTCMGVHSNK